MPNKKSDRYLAGGNWSELRSPIISEPVATYAGDRRKTPPAAPIALLSEVIEHLLPHFRAMSALLNRDGKPQDDRIAQFLESLISTGIAGMSMTAANLESRFFYFLDAEKKDNLHAIYLRSGLETNMIGHMTLRDLSRILKLHPAVYSVVYSSDTVR